MMALRKGLRPSSEVKDVLLRMGKPFVAKLDKLCDVNKRARREIVETLVEEAYGVWEQNPDDRIEPQQ